MTMFTHFQHDGHEPEVVISQNGTLQDRVKSCFIASEHGKSNGMDADSVRQLVTHKTVTKKEANRK